MINPFSAAGASLEPPPFEVSEDADERTNPPPRHDQPRGERTLQIFAFWLLGLSVLASIVVSVTSLPIVYGWFETLIYFGWHGLQPYKDFQFVLPPVIIVYYRVMDSFTHGNFAADRVVGVFVTLMDAGILYYWLRRYASGAAAAVAAAATFILITTEPTYSPSDYHDWVQFFVTLAMILLVTPDLFERSKLSWQSLVRLAGAGCVLQLLVLTKQNVGLGAFVGFVIVVAYLVLDALRRRDRGDLLGALAWLGVASASFVATGAFLLSFFSAGTTIWHRYASFFLVDSKGSPLYAGSRILHDGNNLTTILPAFSVAMAIVLIMMAWQFFTQRVGAEGLGQGLATQSSERLRKLYLIGVYGLLALAPLYIANSLFGAVTSLPEIWLWDFFPLIFALTCYFLDIAFSLGVAFGGAAACASRTVTPLNAMRLVLFGMVLLSNGATAAINIVSAAVFFGYYGAVALNHGLRWARNRQESWLRYAVAVLILLCVPYAIRLQVAKVDLPYGWWGMQDPPIYASSTRVSLPYMTGLRLSPTTTYMYRKVAADIDQFTQPSDRILSYPDVPLFYMLSGRLPMTHSYVQWFDFITEKQAISDFRAVAQQPPKVIVDMSVPTAVYVGHESLLGRKLPQRPFSDYLQCLVDNGGFQELDRFFYNRSDALGGGLYTLRTRGAISAEKIAQIAALTQQYRDVVGQYPTSYVVTGGLGLDNTVMSMSDIQKLPNQNTSEFGGVVIQGNGDQLPALLKYLRRTSHFDLNPNRDNFILRVLKRESGWQSANRSCSSDLDQALSHLHLNQPLA